MSQEEDTKMANLAYQFMQRATLQGNEVQTFLSVVNWLNEKAAPKGEKHTSPAAPPAFTGELQ